MRDGDGRDTDKESETQRAFASLGSMQSGSRFDALVREIQLAENISPIEAFSRASLTEEGKQLWEQSRQEQLSESRALKMFTQDKR